MFLCTRTSRREYWYFDISLLVNLSSINTTGLSVDRGSRRRAYGPVDKNCPYRHRTDHWEAECLIRCKTELARVHLFSRHRAGIANRYSRQTGSACRAVSCRKRAVSAVPTSDFCGFMATGSLRVWLVHDYVRFHTEFKSSCNNYLLLLCNCVQIITTLHNTTYIS